MSEGKFQWTERIEREYTVRSKGSRFIQYRNLIVAVPPVQEELVAEPHLSTTVLHLPVSQ